MFDVRDFTVLTDVTTGYFLVRKSGSKISCTLISSESFGFHTICLYKACADCPYDIPYDYVPASEALFNAIMRSSRRI